MVGMAQISSTPDQHTVTQRLTQRYILALGVIVLLAILGHVFVQLALARQSSDASVIRFATNQRTLAERITMDALAIQANPNQPYRDIYDSDLSQVLAQWQHNRACRP